MPIGARLQLGESALCAGQTGFNRLLPSSRIASAAIDDRLNLCRRLALCRPGRFRALGGLMLRPRVLRKAYDSLTDRLVRIAVPSDRGAACSVMHFGSRLEAVW